LVTATPIFDDTATDLPGTLMTERITPRGVSSVPTVGGSTTTTEPSSTTAREQSASATEASLCDSTNTGLTGPSLDIESGPSLPTKVSSSSRSDASSKVLPVLDLSTSSSAAVDTTPWVADSPPGTTVEPELAAARPRALVRVSDGTEICTTLLPSVARTEKSLTVEPQPAVKRGYLM